MTVIAAVKIDDDVAMASDSMTTGGSDADEILQKSAVKIHRIGDTLLGRAGYAVYGNILDDIFSYPESHPTRAEMPEPCDERGAFRFMLWLVARLKDKYRMVKDSVDNDEYPFINLRANFIFASRKGIFDAGPGAAVSDCGDFWATGSGAPYAMGAIHALPKNLASLRGLSPAGMVAKMAVQAACDLNVYCRPPIQVVELKEREGKATD